LQCRSFAQETNLAFLLAWEAIAKHLECPLRLQQVQKSLNKKQDTLNSLSHLLVSADSNWIVEDTYAVRRRGVIMSPSESGERLSATGEEKHVHHASMVPSYCLFCPTSLPARHVILSD
jgi:hypothetical protein